MYYYSFEQPIAEAGILRSQQARLVLCGNMYNYRCVEQESFDVLQEINSQTDIIDH